MSETEQILNIGRRMVAALERIADLMEQAFPDGDEGEQPEAWEGQSLSDA